MTDKQLTHKTIKVRTPSYEQLLAITDDLSKEKGVPVTLPTTVQLLIEHWRQTRGKQGGSTNA